MSKKLSAAERERRADARREARDYNRMHDVGQFAPKGWPGAGRGPRGKKNPTKAQKRPSKLQRLLASTKRAKQKRVSVALSKFLKQANPGKKYAGCKLQRNAGGSITIIPIKLRRAK